MQKNISTSSINGRSALLSTCTVKQGLQELHNQKKSSGWGPASRLESLSDNRTTVLYDSTELARWYACLCVPTKVCMSLPPPPPPQSKSTHLAAAARESKCTITREIIDQVPTSPTMFTGHAGTFIDVCLSTQKYTVGGQLLSEQISVSIFSKLLMNFELHLITIMQDNQS